METLTELRKQLAEAIERDQPLRIKTVRHKLLIAGLSTQEIDGLVREVQAEILERLIENEDSNYRPALLGIITAALAWFGGELLTSYRASRDAAIRDLIRRLSPAQLRLAFRLPFDRTGQLKPRPVVPANIDDPDASLGTILRSISGLLVVTGDRDESERHPPADLLRDRMEQQFPAATTVQNNEPTVSRPWQNKVRTIGSFLLNESIFDRTIEGVQQRFIQFIRQPLQKFISRLRLELRHELLRLKGQAEDQLATVSDAVAGYTLHSRFLETTAPDHAARDGFRYFKDDRPGSAALWAERLVPPYRKNCVCFTVPILETEAGIFDAEFGLRVSGGEEISIRDVGTFDGWFTAQTPNVQRTVMGDQLFFAAASRGGGRLDYATFFRPNGDPMTVAELLAETDSQRLARINETRRVFSEQTQAYFLSWDQGEGRFQGDAETERSYRRKLDRHLRTATSAID